MLNLGKPTPPLVGRQADEKSTLPYLPTSCMTFHEMENGFAPYLRLPIGILYLPYLIQHTLWWAGQVRHAAPHAARIPAGLFPRGFSFFSPSFFFKSGAGSSCLARSKRFKSFWSCFMLPGHTSRLLILRCESRRPIRSTAVLSSPDFAVTVAVHLSIIRTPGHRRDNVDTNQISTAEVVTTKHQCMMEEHVYCE